MPKKVRKPALQSREHAMSAENTILLTEVQRGLEHAVSQRSWVVVICPNPQSLREVNKFLAALMPNKATHSGRTILLPNGGKVSTTLANQPVFVPSKDDFTAVFLGWEKVDQSQYREMTTWRDQAKSTLDTSNA